MGQLTGTALNNSGAVGISGTDLGVSFVEAAPLGRLIFLFGDVWRAAKHRDEDRVKDRWDQDNAAWTDATTVPTDDALPKLHWFVRRDGQFQEPQFPAGNAPKLSGMNVPVEGIAVRGKNYVFFQTRWGARYRAFIPVRGCPRPDREAKRHSHSVLAHTPGSRFDWSKLVVDWHAATAMFINVSAFVEGDTVWIFGTGFYRYSHIYLAKVATAHFAQRSRWQYYKGIDAAGNPAWSAEGDETAAAPVVETCFGGELSVRPHPELGYLMMYQAGDGDLSGVPRGVHLRRAAKPWGPWEPPINLLDLSAAYGHFMHSRMPDHADFDDGLAEPGRHKRIENPDTGCPGDGWRENCTGGEYGPYQVPQWARKRDDGAFEIFYTLSSWNPYQVQLMRSVLAFASDPGPQSTPPRGVGLPPAHLTNSDFASGLLGWHSIGDSFTTFVGSDGIPRMTTFTSKGAAATGALYQDFTVDANTKSLSFLIHGGEAVVRLHRGVEIIRESRGRSGHEPRNDPQDTRVCWNIVRYAGETLRVAIFDGVDSGPWGFVGATRFQFHAEPCRSRVVVPDAIRERTFDRGRVTPP